MILPETLIACTNKNKRKAKIKNEENTKYANTHKGMKARITFLRFVLRILCVTDNNNDIDVTFYACAGPHSLCLSKMYRDKVKKHEMMRETMVLKNNNNNKQNIKESTQH